MSPLLFTGERLHADDELFAIDVVRHRAAYAYAIELAKKTASQHVLEVGCGTGYGTAELAEALPGIIAVDRIAPEPGDQVIVKKRASGFHGTYLSSFLKANGIDTVIITGVTMAGCVRHTTEDAIAEGFRPIVVREAVGDRVPGVVEWNLFDIDSKFGDVESVDDVVAYLDGIEPYPRPNS